MVGPIDVKWKGDVSVGYWMNYVTLTFDLTHDLDLWFFKVKFQNSCIWGIVIWLMWNKESKSIRYWADCGVLPFYSTHELDLVVSRSKFEIALFEEWEGWLTWNERDVSQCLIRHCENLVGIYHNIPSIPTGKYSRGLIRHFVTINLICIFHWNSQQILSIFWPFQLFLTIAWDEQRSDSQLEMPLVLTGTSRNIPRMFQLGDHNDHWNIGRDQGPIAV